MKCSFLVANYNNAHYLQNLISSIYDQTYKNWEVVIVDDNSSDNSLSVIKEYLNDTRFKFIQLRENNGVGFTKKVAADNATGDILVVADPDDALTSNALEVISNEHKLNPQASMIYSTHYICDSDMNILGTSGWVKEIPAGKTNFHEDCISHLVSFKKSKYFLTSGFDPSLRSAEDKDLFYKLEEVGPVIFINQPLYYYRRNKESIYNTQTYKSAGLDRMKVLFATFQRRKKNGFPNISRTLLRKQIGSIYLWKSQLIVYKELRFTSDLYKYLFLSLFNDPLGNNVERIKLSLYLFPIKKWLLSR